MLDHGWVCVCEGCGTSRFEPEMREHVKTCRGKKMNKELIKVISTVTKLEGKKKSVSVGNVREIMAILRKLCKDPYNFKIITAYLCKP